MRLSRLIIEDAGTDALMAQLKQWKEEYFDLEGEEQQALLTKINALKALLSKSVQDDGGALTPGGGLSRAGQSVAKEPPPEADAPEADAPEERDPRGPADVPADAPDRQNRDFFTKDPHRLIGNTYGKRALFELAQVADEYGLTPEGVFRLYVLADRAEGLAHWGFWKESGKGLCYSVENQNDWEFSREGGWKVREDQNNNVVGLIFDALDESMTITRTGGLRELARSLFGQALRKIGSPFADKYEYLKDRFNGRAPLPYEVVVAPWEEQAEEEDEPEQLDPDPTQVMRQPDADSQGKQMAGCSECNKTFNSGEVEGSDCPECGGGLNWFAQDENGRWQPAS